MTGEATVEPTCEPTCEPLRTRHVVVMGVSGCGKTTVARGVAAATGFVMAEGDEFHPPANVEKMRAGIPLDDEDRWPWLRDLAGWMGARAAEGRSTVISCSALKRAYRTVLAEGLPIVEFVHLDGSADVIRGRMSSRAGHYMPTSLLDSQVATLEPLGADESGLVLDVALSPSELVDRAVEGLGLRRGAPPQSDDACRCSSLNVMSSPASEADRPAARAVR
ncbi:gluconate kinase [Intrasporangium oryzae NRRL B-24470]|uniref:Gluconokinase n=1 Tax=Intrasporangium oryzae NRRL B-24470 TaxID=1386089 RepID=W9G7W9_9MICO|nr:gluconokinase [Intrasporangium oryzae]EWT01367.1 gluconate kinase [Intrasporangium oryzae NRRL B-24470]